MRIFPPIVESKRHSLAGVHRASAFHQLFKADNLEFAPEQSEPVLARLAESPGLLGFGAQMTLREWRAGRLRFP